jgi:triphosphoribosyl-dephospho-CoA synthase
VSREYRSERNAAGPAEPLPIGQCATLACLLEVTAPKPGNVHRGADFEDLGFSDFAVSAVRIAPAMQRAVEQGVGATIWQAIHDTRSLVPTNTNLGMVLLMAPLAAVPREVPLDDGVRAVLGRLTPDDARLTYLAIRLAGSRALGKADEMDVADEPPADLLRAMAAARDRDLIARQYVENFSLVLDEVCPELTERLTRHTLVTEAILLAFLATLARHTDSLIARKCGIGEAREASDRAAQVLAAGEFHDERFQLELAEFDFWLRAAGHRRNPGTTADLIAAALFALLRDGRITSPFR